MTSTSSLSSRIPPILTCSATSRSAHDLVRAACGYLDRWPVCSRAGDLVVPPVAVHRPWVLDGEYHVDGESFEINPVTWYTLASYGVAIRGEFRDRLGVYVDAADRRSWVAENLDTYWRGVADALATGVADSDESEWGGEILESVALGVARMLYTFETGDVASKSAAGPLGCRADSGTRGRLRSSGHCSFHAWSCDQRRAPRVRRGRPRDRRRGPPVAECHIWV